MNESTEILPAADQSRRIKTREGRFTRLPPHDIDDADDVEKGTAAVSDGPVSDDEVAGLLRQVPFLKDLEEELFQRLCDAAELVEFGMNERVVREGERGDSIFIVASGSFDVYKSTADGRERVLTFHRPSDYFGEGCVLDENAVHTETIQAATSNATCLKLQRADVKPVLDELSEAQQQRLVQRAKTARDSICDAPRWFEHAVFAKLETVYLGRSWTYWLIFGLLVSAPFLASAGRFVRVINGCPDIGMIVDGALALGIFMFCLIWVFLFEDFCNAVRGASRIQNRIRTGESRAAAEALSVQTHEDRYISAADKYRALRAQVGKTAPTTRSHVTDRFGMATHGRELSNASAGLVSSLVSTDEQANEAPSDSIPTMQSDEPIRTKSSKMMDTGYQVLHVRGIGVDGWDGTVDGRGSFEYEEPLSKLFSQNFGPVVSVTIRHRIADGANTSWALVTMETTQGAEAALSSPAVMAGTNKLVITRYDKKVAKTSRGAMKRVAVQVVAAIRMQSSIDLEQKVGKQGATLAAEHAMLESHRNALREALAAVLETACDKRTGDGGAALAQSEESILRADFEEADVEHDGCLKLDEWASLLQSLLGIQLSDKEVNRIAAAAQAFDVDGNGELSFEEFLSFWKHQTKGAPGQGALCSLAFRGGLGIDRQNIHRKNLVFLNALVYVDCALCVVLLIGVAYMTAGVVEMIVADVFHDGLDEAGELYCSNCTFAAPVHFMLGHGAGCVPQTTYTIYMILTVIILIPACFIAAILWPLWFASFQLGVVFAGSDVGAVLKELRPSNVRRWQAEALLSRNHEQKGVSQGEMLWQTEVSLPAAMLVSTMRQLSTWGQSLGAAVFCCTAFVIGLLPTANYHNWNNGLTLVISLVSILPALAAIQPAYVTTSCLLMQEQLNDISFMGDSHIKRRCQELRQSFHELNNRQGLGWRMRLHLTLSVAVFLLCAMPMQFVVFNMVINTKMLSTVAVVMYTTVSTAVLGLSAMSHEAQILKDISDKISNMTGSYP